MTLDELCLGCSARTGMTNSVGHEDRTLMEKWANEGVIRVLEKTRVRITNVTVSLTPGVDNYVLSSAVAGNGVLNILSAERSGGGGKGRLIQLDFETLQQYRRANPSSGVKYFALLGDNRLIISGAALTGESINIEAIPKPTKMTSGSNDPSNNTYGGIPEDGHKAIEDWMAYRAMQRLRDPADAAIAAARKEFESEVSEFRKFIRQRAGRGLPRARIGYPEWRNLNSRNDVYPSDG